MPELASRFFFGVRRNLRPPARWLYLTNDEGGEGAQATLKEP
jgi:hypothetical protein